MPVLAFMLMPVLGALIGWVTNVLAIRGLFWPRQPIAVAGIVLWGVIPRHREELARAAGEVIAGRLLSGGDVVDGLDLGGVEDRLVDLAARSAAAAGERMLPSVFPRILRQGIGRLASAVIERTGRDAIAGSLGPVLAEAAAAVDVADLCRQRVLAVPLEELEQMVRSVAGRELRAIELLGAGIGFMIGLAQAALWWLLRQPGTL